MPLKYRKKCICEYDGSGYSGWQFQKEYPSIQQTIEEALYILYREKINIIGSGRTDAGVHALGQVFHFSTSIHRENHSITAALNSMLPRDIAILSTEDVPADFHAQLSARHKTYRYMILNRSSRAALDTRRVWFRRTPIDEEKLWANLQPLVGSHDFTSFCVAKSLKENCVRTVNFIEVEKHDDHLAIQINANGFLHNMVRIIVGTGVALTLDSGGPADMKSILEARDRRQALVTAPPQGLYLEKVYY